MNEPALAIIEYKSVAKGIYSCDFMVKKAPIRIVDTKPICPGKYLTIICGNVADVEESLKAGLESGGSMVVSDLFLPQVHSSVIPAIAGTTEIEKFGAIGIIETFDVSTCIKAADIAAKMSPVNLVDIRLANGLGGKAFFVITGDLADLESSLEAAKQFVEEEGMLTACEIIPSPHSDLIDKAVYW